MALQHTNFFLEYLKLRTYFITIHAIGEIEYYSKKCNASVVNCSVFHIVSNEMSLSTRDFIGK